MFAFVAFRQALELRAQLCSTVSSFLSSRQGDGCAPRVLDCVSSYLFGSSSSSFAASSAASSAPEVSPVLVSWIDSLRVEEIVDPSAAFLDDASSCSSDSDSVVDSSASEMED